MSKAITHLQFLECCDLVDLFEWSSHAPKAVVTIEYNHALNLVGQNTGPEKTNIHGRCYMKSSI